MTTVQFKSLSETKKWVVEFAKTLRRGDLLLLRGPMGAGKTQVVRWLVEALGGDAVSSPTFAIHQSYTTSSFTVDHMDLYRLESRVEFDSAGLWDFVNDFETVLVIEWPERVPSEWWPKERRRIELEIRLKDSPEAREFAVVSE